MDIIVADLETNGFKPNVIHVVGVLDLATDEFIAYTGDDVPEGLLRIQRADRIIGHHFRGYDKVQIERLTEGLILLPDEKIDDTLEIARALFPEMENHKLKTWGEILGSHKIEYEGGFDEFDPRMVPYCEQDCRLNKILYEFLLSQL